MAEALAKFSEKEAKFRYGGKESMAMADRGYYWLQSTLKSLFPLFVSIALVICYGYMATGADYLGTVELVRNGPFCAWFTSVADNPPNLKPTVCSFGGRLADIFFVLAITAVAIGFFLPSLLKRLTLNTAAWSVDSTTGYNNYLRLFEWLTFLYAAVFSFVWLFLAVNAFFRPSFAPGGNVFALAAAADGIHSLAAATNMFFSIFSIMNLVFWSIAILVHIIALKHYDDPAYWFLYTLDQPVTAGRSLTPEDAEKAHAHTRGNYHRL